MVDQFIQIDFQGLSLKFLRVFLNQDLPRRNDEVIETARSTYGTFYVKRRVYEEYHRWQFETLIDRVNQPILDAMFWEHNYLVRTKSTAPSPSILLTDGTRLFTERSPRTRAKAAAPFDTVSTFGTSPLFVSYYAKYYVYFEKEPEYSIQDQTLKVSLSFIEENRKVSPSLDG